MKQNNYEGLLPLDPLGALDKMKENYLLYFNTAYRFANESIEKKKREALADTKAKVAFREPYIEILPEYKSADMNLEDCISADKELSKAFSDFPDFAEFIKRGLMNYKPYLHQVEMLKKSFLGIQNGNKKRHNTIITSGTGSGKTESFMLPLIASLLKEAKSWDQQNYNLEWMNNLTYNAPFQRIGEHGNRKAAIRSLIMYPMNALVEDQLTRLRIALDSDEVCKFMDDNFKGNRIFFGQYNGATIGGSKTINDISKLPNKDDYFKGVGEKIKKLKDDYSALKEYIKEKEKYMEFEKLQHSNTSQEVIDSEKEYKKANDARSITPKLTKDSITAEMVTRWDMQSYPPDILITNFSMLSIMLMRHTESEMFRKTREWFEGDPDKLHPKRIFHLVIDELHLYRNTSGTEIAYLIRMFLNNIGVPPTITVNGEHIPNPQLHILASSASLGNSQDTQEFARQFFGTYYDDGSDVFNIIRGQDITLNNLNYKIDYNDFKLFNKDYAFLSDNNKKDIKQKLFSKYGCNDDETFVKTYSERIFYDFSHCMTRNVSGKDIVCPIDLTKLCEALKCGKNALRGFFIFRADNAINKLCSDPQIYKLPRFRFHQYFRYIEGLWAELTPQQDSSFIGDVIFNATPLHNGHKVLELLRCECCGEMYIGGNVNRHQRELVFSLNSPNLDKIPNRNPTTMVQNKKYDEYAIFWPTNHEDGKTLNTTQISFKHNDSKLKINTKWEKAWLNPFDGRCVTSFTGDNNWIPGYLYVIENDYEKCPALPSICPHCLKDYQQRKYTFSPIRNFRTGIKRNNQILSKELMYQLPHDDKKLISFSDSRQDAAEQAEGIAVEHYRDMVRLLFMQLVDAGINKDSNELEKLKEQLDPQPYDEKNYISQITYAQGLSNNVKSDLIKIINSDISTENKINSIKNYHEQKQDILLRDFVTSLGETYEPGGLLVEKLLNLGINPAGPAFKEQNFNNRHWSCNFYRERIQEYNSNDRVSDLLKAAVFKNSFGQFMGVSTEDVGLGYITYKFKSESLKPIIEEFHLSNEQAQNFMAAVIRVLGDAYRYEDPDGYEDKYEEKKISNLLPTEKVFAHYLRSKNVPESDILSGKNKMGTRLKALCEKVQAILVCTKEKDVHDNIIDIFRADHNGKNMNGIQLQFEYMTFHRPNENDNYYTCNICHRIHLHEGMGICTNPQCKGNLELAKDINGYPLKLKGLRNSNYIGHDIDVEPREATRIKTEELTGQTDKQRERLLHFKGIIIEDTGNLSPKNKANIAKTKEIDMLNVTTTMEVGVDIGNLLAIFQGNMPPTRYNYQQRVGRGGRRGQAFSAAITFCRGKSHDSYYYDEGIDEMIGGAPALPKLAIAQSNNNETIVKRVIVKDILHQAFLTLDVNTDTLNDTCGEFDSVNKWKINKSALEIWIKKNYDAIKKTTTNYLDKYGNNSINSIVTWVQNDLTDTIDRLCNKACNLEMGLAQYLSEEGILPMYGMPSSIREFYHGYKTDFLSIDRPLEQSITEFAPGAIKTKDHGEYMSAGLTVSPKTKKFSNLKGISDKEKKRWDALEHTYCMVKGNHDTISDIKNADDPKSFDDETKIRLVIPKAYRTSEIHINNGDIGNNDDRSDYTQATLWVKETDKFENKSIANFNYAYWSSGQGTDTGVWYINDNNGKLFEGTRQYYHAENEIDPIKWNKSNKNDLPQEISNEIIKKAPNFIVGNKSIKYGTYSNGLITGEQLKIALGAKKSTDLLKISIHKYDSKKLCLDVNSGYRPAIISAFYSAATLIQRVFADEMDIVPEELEISEIKIDLKSGIPSMYLNDSLVNGSGYVNMLVSKYTKNGKKYSTMLEYIMNRIVNFEGTFMQSILNHRNTCQTACVKCLQTFYNIGYHHILDWRLGVDLIKLMLDSNYKMGNGDWETPYEDLQDIIDKAGSNAANADINVQFDKDTKILTYANFKEKIEHPLWNYEHDKGRNFFEIFRTGFVKKSTGFDTLQKIKDSASSKSV